MNDLSINKKTHTEGGTGFLDLLARYQPASNAHLQNNETLQSLADLLKPENLLFVNDVIAPNGHDLPTANSVAAVLHNADFAPTNAAIYPLDEQQPFTLHAVKDEAFVIGTGKRFLAFDDLEAAVILADCLADNGRQSDFTIIVPFHARQLEGVVKAHAKARHVEVFTLLDTARQYANTLQGENVTVYGATDFLPLLINDLKGDIDALINNEQIHNATISEWGEPEPLDDDPSQPTRYPIEAWQGMLRDAVEAIAYHAQVPHAVAGAAVLGALATIVQRQADAPYHEGGHMPAALFLLTEYPSGEGKTMANDLAYQSIDIYQQKQDENHRIKLAEWKAEKAATKRSELEAFLISNPEPNETTLTVGNATLQGILDNLLINPQKGITWKTADCGQFFGGYSLKSENIKEAIASLSDIWSKGKFDRVLSPRAKHAIEQKRAYGVRFSVDLAGQHDIIKPALDDDLMNNQGFLPRFLFAFPPVIDKVVNTPERMNNTSNHDPRLIKFWDECRYLLDPSPNGKQENDQQPNSQTTDERVKIGFADQAARQALADYKQSAQDRKKTVFSKYTAYASRLAENASRIATLMAFFEGRTSLTVNDIHRASLLTEYSITERLRYDEAPPVGGSNSKKLIDWMVKRCKQQQTDRLSYAEVQSYVSSRALRRKPEFELALAVLVDKQHAKTITQGESRLIQVNPTLLK